jgi:hypothetical protein
MDETKHFDVAKPGASPAEPNSRSIIGRKVLVTDPMMGQGDTAATEIPAVTVTPEPKPPAETGPVIKPSEGFKAELETEAKTVTSVATTPTSSDLASSAKTDGKKPAAETEESKAAEYDKGLDKLVESKKYFLPIKESGHHRSLILLITLVTGVAALAFAALEWL